MRSKLMKSEISIAYNNNFDVNIENELEQGDNVHRPTK